MEDPDPEDVEAGSQPLPHPHSLVPAAFNGRRQLKILIQQWRRCYDYGCLYSHEEHM